MRSKRLVFLLILSCMASSNSAVLADSKSVSAAEERVLSIEKSKGKNSPDYFSNLLGLACEYKRNNMHEKAEQTYKQTLELLKEKPDRKEKLPETMMYWAGVLGQTKDSNSIDDKKLKEQKQKDFQEAEILMDKATGLYEQLPEISDNKFLAFSQQIYFLKTRGKKDAAQKAEQRLDKILQEAERKKLSQSEALSVFRALDLLANLQQKGVLPGVHRLGPEAIKKHPAPKLSVSEFKTAESYKLRGLAVLDKLPGAAARDSAAAKAHWDMYLWYSYFGEKKKASEQREKF